MSEFKLEYLASELLKLLGSSAPPEKFVELMQIEESAISTGTVSKVSLVNCIKHLEETCLNPELFRHKFEQLTSKKLDILSPFVQLIYLIKKDEDLKTYLSRTLTMAETKESKITTDDVSHIFEKVKRAALEGERKLGRQTTIFSKDQSSSLMKQNWSIDRPLISWDFDRVSTMPPSQKVVPSASQESILLWDILWCLKGIDGTYIVSEAPANPHDPISFKISEDVDLQYKQLTKQILPLASYYSTTIRFIEESISLEFGRVNHALRGALNCLMKDYFSFVVQLEMEHRRGKLNLQKLWFYIQSTMVTMSILAKITCMIMRANAKGGKVLTLLHELLSDISGETNSKELCLFLMKNACVPYMQTLEKWVYKGVIYDPYNEFFVEDNELIQKEELPMDYSADYWEKRYTMRYERIPIFLNQHAQTILRTGKYFNVIRQCGKTVQWGKQEPLVYEHRDQTYIAAIDRAYSEAARTLLEVLIHENDLMGRLRSVKNYFLLAQGDFIVQFMNLCETELSKNMYDVVIHRLASLLEMALRVSTADSDPYKDDLKPVLLPCDLQYQMFRILSIQTQEEKEYSSQSDKVLTGLEAFVFNYDVKWPVSLILNRKAIACYQMLFRHLFYCKHIERLLCRVWIRNKIAKSFTHQEAMNYRQAFSLRHRMLDCIQHLEYYMMVEVIEPNWLTFLNEMSKVSNVDDVLGVHQKLLDSIMKECMLTDPDLLSCITGICKVCIQFCEFMQKSADSTTADEGTNFDDKISILDRQFSNILIQLLEKICNLDCQDANEKWLNVLGRLDFNSFYMTTLMRQKEENEIVNEDVSG